MSCGYRFSDSCIHVRGTVNEADTCVLVQRIAPLFPVSQSDYMKQLLERDAAYICRSFPDRNVSDNDSQSHEKVS